MMQGRNNLINEQMAANAFSVQAPVFDHVYGKDGMIAYKRDRVRQQMEQYLKPGSRILELNAGTGEDALHFAKLGHTVHATDVSTGMLEQLKIKTGKEVKISCEKCSYHSLATLSDKEPFDHIFSNFAGLNCTGELNKVLLSLPPLLNPGALVTLVIMPRFCIWETLMLFKGKFKTAFRRWFSQNGRKAFVEGQPFRCWYYDPSYIKRHTKHAFTILHIEGLCTIVPPSYIEGFDKKYPRLFQRLCFWESRFGARWPWRSMGDYYIVTMKKNEATDLTD